MKKYMQEQQQTDWAERIAAYIPQTEQEWQDQAAITAAVQQDGCRILSRERTQGHVTCSGFVMNPALDAVLMVHHNIYHSFSWTGGHADGSTDLLWKAVQEVREETGVQKPFPLSGAILSIDLLPVPAHQKHGAAVPAHVHYNITYGIIASQKETCRVKPDESSAVQWIPIDAIQDACNEPHMLLIYEKLIERMHQCQAQQQSALQGIAAPLLRWYPSHARDLPWRHAKEPYPVWISEIMLQQTLVEAVKDYYRRFLAQFPDVQSLANATQDQVNKQWEGLGYYNRAANLRKAAIAIVTEYGGSFPSTWERIRQLPGIGDYTAGAVGSICFSLPTPAVDGNVLRVAARVTDCFCEIDRPQMKASVTKALAVQYQQHPNDCGTLTQALIELGATVCLPNGQPHCDACPLEAICLAHQNHDVLRLPQHVEKKKLCIEQYTVFILCCDGKYAIRKRTEKGLLHGLWEYPNIPGICSETEAIQQARAWQCKPLDLTKTVEWQHIFTHVEWELYGVFLTCGQQPNAFVWKTAEEIAAEISLPTAFR